MVDQETIQRVSRHGQTEAEGPGGRGELAERLFPVEISGLGSVRPCGCGADEGGGCRKAAILASLALSLSLVLQLLEENDQLIRCIVEYQNKGCANECVQ